MEYLKEPSQSVLCSDINWHSQQDIPKGDQYPLQQ